MGAMPNENEGQVFDPIITLRPFTIQSLPETVTLPKLKRNQNPVIPEVTGDHVQPGIDSPVTRR